MLNGAGKTTVIHALACVYQPDHVGPRSEDYKFPYFFIPNTDSLWSGSEFSIINEIENERHIKITLPPRTYHKDFDRWAPRYENRPKRNVYYLGIDSCLPDIEKSTPTSRIRYTPHESTDPKAQKTIEKAGGILNKRYTMLFDIQKTLMKCKFDDILLLAVEQLQKLKILSAVYHDKTSFYDDKIRIALIHCLRGFAASETLTISLPENLDELPLDEILTLSAMLYEDVC